MIVRRKAMPNKTKISLIVKFLVLIFCSAFVFKSEQITPNIIRAQNQPAKLSIEVSSSQKSYLQGEPISINLKLFNQTDQPISWRGFLDVSPNINFFVQDANGKKLNWEASKYATGSVYSTLKTMQPGEQVQQPLLLERGLAEELFSNPGQYNLQVEFAYYTESKGRQQAKVLSNSIFINILAPQGIDRQAYSFIKETLEPNLRKPNVQELAQLQQDFVARYRNSVYAKYIIFNLANTYQTIGEDEKALRELCKISGENFYYSKHVEKILYRIDEKLHSTVQLPLPENATVPPRPHPCRAVQN